MYFNNIYACLGTLKNGIFNLGFLHSKTGSHNHQYVVMSGIQLRPFGFSFLF